MKVYLVVVCEISLLQNTLIYHANDGWTLHSYNQNTLIFEREATDRQQISDRLAEQTELRIDKEKRIEQLERALRKIDAQNFNQSIEKIIRSVL